MIRRRNKQRLLRENQANVNANANAENVNVYMFRELNSVRVIADDENTLYARNNAPAGGNPFALGSNLARRSL